MVHRNSEYKLKFYSPNEELSKKIWLDNIRLRESRRAMNLADHYWDFQTSKEICDCEDCTSLRVKNDGKSKLKGKEKNDILISSGDVDQTDHRQNDINSHDYQDASVQTPNWFSAPCRKMSCLNKFTTVKKCSTNKNVNLVPTKKEEEEEKRPPTTKKYHCKKAPSVAGTSQYSLSKMTKRLKDMDEVQGPFFPFGWKNVAKNIGDMKTFNVLAPPKEVHIPAVMAMKRRKAYLEEIVSKEEKKKKSASLLSLPRINHSSIWITEYGEKFSRRPVTSR